ncbi:hypothetical protein V497_03038 [Pseudogymnoascus sp. VKM F-4516 (FW-969)]|nr:hypothetical protein V497_03038 [Pseudogymnoascus sp. VKM F-4516 (FW-969)]
MLHIFAVKSFGDISKPVDGFSLCNPDLSASNRFVDSELNITCVIDLAFASTVPVSTSLITPAYRILVMAQSRSTIQRLSLALLRIVTMTMKSSHRPYGNALVGRGCLPAWLFLMACKITTILTQKENKFVELAEELADDEEWVPKILKDEEDYFAVIGKMEKPMGGKKEVRLISIEMHAIARKINMVAELTQDFVADYWIEEMKRDSETIADNVLADLLGPSYEAPVDLASNKSLVAAAWRNATATLQTYISHGSEASKVVAAVKNITFSVGMFSLEDPAARKMQFHYTSPEVANAPNGTHKVDGDTIYRMASVTKAFTVLAGLLEVNSTDWERPITDFVPTLAKYAQKAPGEDDPIHITQWDKVTLSALAAQIGGIPRDPFPVNEILDPATITALGLPPLNPDDPLSLPPCVLPENNHNGVCDEIPYLESIQNRPPALLPWTSPGYSDMGFMLLGVAIANITGKPLTQVYRESIFEPLGMVSSYASSPPKSEWHRSAIPDLATFDLDAGILVSTGGLLTTTNDMAKFGVGVLNSTLLPDEETRKWLKPVSHTAHFEYSVGRPWEIMRYTHSSGVITDIYTKLGDSGSYSGFIVLLPDYNAGFSILSGSTSTRRFSVVTEVAEVVTSSILPALAAQAAKESEKKFAGVYNSTVQGLESSLTLSVNHTKGAAPGLVVSSWISNGTDVLAQLPTSIGAGPYRLIPSILDPEAGTEAFRLVASLDAPIPPSAGAPKKLFTSMSYLTGDWLVLDSPTYGGIGVSLFVFKIGSDGNVEEVRPEAFRVSLKRSC